MNPPYKFNQQFQPIIYDNWLNHEANMFVLVTDSCAALKFIQDHLDPVYERIVSLPGIRKLDRLSFKRVDKSAQNRATRKIKQQMPLDQQSLALKDLKDDAERADAAIKLKYFSQRCSMIPMLQPQLVDLIMDLRIYQSN